MNHLSPYIGIQRGETKFTIAYAIMAFFMGAFISIFDVLVHALFFEEFGYKFLSGSYIISGFTGMVATYLFSLIFRRLNTYQLTLLVYGMASVICTSFLVLALIMPLRIVIFSGMVIFFPINTLFLLTFWRYGRKLLYPSQSRKIFPVVKITHMAGLALGGAIFTASLFFFKFKSLYFICMVLLGGLFISQFFLNRIHKKARIFNDGKEKFVPVQNNYLLFLNSRYTAYIFLFVFLSSIIGFFIHFAFMNATWANFANNIGMSKFYGLFIATLIVFVYGIDRFLVKRILYSYDSPYSLVLIPPLIFLAIALAIAGIYAPIKKMAYEHFTIFFILLAIAKVGYVTSQMTIQVPSFRALFHSLDIRFRQYAYPRVEGSIVMAGLTAAGIIILSLAMLKFYSLTIILFVALVCSILWFWVAIKMIKAYQQIQKHELEKLRFKRTSSQSEGNFEENLWKLLVKDNPAKIVESLKLSLIIQPMEYERDLQRLLAHPSENVRRYVYNCIANEKIESLLPDLKKKADTEDVLQTELLTIIQHFEKPNPQPLNVELIKEKVYTGTIEERMELAYQIPILNFEEKEGVLVALSKDYDRNVREASIKSLARMKVKDLSYSLIDFIYPGQYNSYAFDAIASSGDKAVDYLEREMMMPGTDNLVLARIIRLLGKIGTPRAIGLLISQMGDLDSYLTSVCVQSLIDNKYQASPENRYKLLKHVVRLTDQITYNLNITLQLKNKKGCKSLLFAYATEMVNNYGHLFRLLSLLYNANVVSALRKTFLNGSRAEINHAIELTDQYIDNDLRPLIFTLIEDVPETERLKKLNYFFPQFNLSIKDILSDTLTHDYNTLSLYPRACAMIYCWENNKHGFLDELLFNAGHAHPLLHETALFVLKNLQANAKKKSDIIESLLREDLYSIPEWGNLFYNRYSELKEFTVFNEVEEFVGLEMAKTAKKFGLSESEGLQIDELETDYFMLLPSNPSLFRLDDHEFKTGNMFLPVGLLQSMGIRKISGISDAGIWAFRKNTIHELLHDNTDLANLILKSTDNLKIVERNEG